MNQTRWLSDFKYDREATPLLWSFDDPTQDVLPCKETSRSVSSPSIMQLLSSSTNYSVGDPGETTMQDDDTKTIYPDSSPVKSLSATESPRSKSNRYAQINYQESEKLYLLSQVRPFPSYLTIGTNVEDDISNSSPTSQFSPCQSQDDSFGEISEMCAYENPAFEHDKYSSECFDKDYRELHSGTTRALSDPGCVSDKNIFLTISASASEDVYNRQSETDSTKKACDIENQKQNSQKNVCYNPFHSGSDEMCQCMDIVDDVELAWDAYLPPLELRWSDIMIKDIFDLVEKDNEEHVQRIRSMVKKRDYRPFNILQRLCWYDEESHTVQSLVGVFEYDV